MKLKNFSRLYWHEAVIILLTAAIMLTMLCGCTQAQVDRAKAAQAQAEQYLAQADAARVAAAAVLEQVKVIAAQIGGEKAAALIAQAESAKADADAGFATAKALVDTSSSAVAAAEKSQAAGGLTLDVILAAVGAFATGGASIAAAVVPLINKYKRAVTVTANHADRMEAAETNSDVIAAKTISVAEQAAAGVTAIITKARA